MRNLAMLLGAILALALIGAASADNSLTINLDQINGSGVSGTAVLTPQGGQTQIVVTINGEPAGGSEPMHVHTGQCGPTLGGVKYPLKNVEGGTSTTVINTSLASIQTGGFAINVHQSAANIGTYVACGNIPALAATTALPKTGGVPTTAVVLVAGGLLGVGYALRRRLAAGL
jgi:LPXTG-motif cell wall-anchored protein